MAQFTINIPNGQLNRILDAFGSQYGYQPNIKDADGNEVPNPKNKSAFLKEIIIQIIKDAVKQHEGEQAANNARANVSTQIDNINID